MLPKEQRVLEHLPLMGTVLMYEMDEHIIQMLSPYTNTFSLDTHPGWGRHC